MSLSRYRTSSGELKIIAVGGYALGTGLTDKVQGSNYETLKEFFSASQVCSQFKSRKWPKLDQFVVQVYSIARNYWTTMAQHFPDPISAAK